MKNLRLPLRIAQTPISLDGYDKKELPGGQEIADKLEAGGSRPLYRYGVKSWINMGRK